MPEEQQVISSENSAAGFVTAGSADTSLAIYLDRFLCTLLLPSLTLALPLLRCVLAFLEGRRSIRAFKLRLNLTLLKVVRLIVCVHDHAELLLLHQSSLLEDSVPGLWRNGSSIFCVHFCASSTFARVTVILGHEHARVGCSFIVFV